MTPTGAFLTVDGARVHYRRAGSGPPLVLIHGANGSLRDWSFRLFDRLASAWDVVAFDRPGHGFSERIRGAHSIHVQAAHLRKAAEALGITQAVLCGHSFGGSVALAWADDAPDSVTALCLLAAPSHEWESTAGRLYALADAPVLGPVASAVLPRLAGPKLVENALARVFAPDPMPEGYPDALSPGLALRYRTVRANAADINRLKPQLVAMTPRYPALDMPVEILHGTDDLVVPLHIHSERLIGALPRARLSRLVDTGHMPHHTRSDEMFAAIGRLREAEWTAA